MIDWTAFIKATEMIQSRENLSNYSFAKKCGIPKSTWSLIVNGKRQIGMAVFERLVSAYPELKKMI